MSNVSAVLPAAAVVFVKRRVLEVIGLALLAGGLAWFGLLLSFNAADPSFNHATPVIPSNWLGAFGSHAADLLLVSIGVAAAIPAAALSAWGWRILGKRPLPRPRRKIAAILGGTVTSTIAFAALPPFGGWSLPTGMGGVVGVTLYNALVTPLAGLFPAAPLVALIAAVIGGVLVCYGIGVTPSEITASLRGVRDGFATLARTIRGIPNLFRRPMRSTRSEATLAPRPRAVRQPRAATSATTAAETKDSGIVERSIERLRTPRKAPADGQQSFVFETADEKGFRLPALELLTAPPTTDVANVSEDALEQNAKLLGTVLDDFGVRGDIVKVRPGPVVSLYELEPAPGTKSSRVIALADDIARSMSAISARVAVIPGRNVIGIELPNSRREPVGLRELLASQTYVKHASRLSLALGKEISGQPVIADLARMPHLLIAGTTGSGKSVAINAMILSLLYRLSPADCRLILIDPKMLELKVYDDIPHLLCPVVTEPGKAVVALKWTVREMESRYRAMSNLGVRNIAGYNARVEEAERNGEPLVRSVQVGFSEDGQPRFEEQHLDLKPLPLIVVVVDEMADLMLVAGKDIEQAVQRLSQMARAAGIHLIMATQRPSVDVITGTIKANFPTRISFQVTSKIDSRTILGEQGAEQLLGQGDMLYMASGGRITRVHGPFVSDAEVERVVGFLKSQGQPDYVAEVTEDPDEAFGGDESEFVEENDSLYAEALNIVTLEGKASTSFVQRRLQIGYNRAARMIERMEREGVVSKPDRVGRREVLIADRAG